MKGWVFNVLCTYAVLRPFIHFCEAIPTLPYGRCFHSLTPNAEILEASLIAFPKYMNVPI